jgi:hypothetical protein
MVWPFRKKLTKYDQAKQEIDEHVRGLFQSSELLTNSLKIAWKEADIDFGLEAYRDWGIGREINWYFIAQWERALKYKLHAPNVDQAIDDIVDRTLDLHCEVANGDQPPSIEYTLLIKNWMSKSQTKAMESYRTPINISEGLPSLPQFGSIGSIVEGSPLHTLTKRIERVIRWEVRTDENGGLMLPSGFMYDPENYVWESNAAYYGSSLDPLNADPLAWRDAITLWIGGPGTNFDKFLRSVNFVRLLETVYPSLMLGTRPGNFY